MLLQKCPIRLAICCFGGGSPIPPVEAEQERNTNGFLYGQNVRMPQLSPKHLISWRAGGSLRQRGQQGRPRLPFPGTHLYMQRPAPPFVQPCFRTKKCLQGGSSWTGGVLQRGGDPSEHTLFLHPWSSQITAEDGGCPNTVRRVKNLFNCNYLKLLRQNPCDVA